MKHINIRCKKFPDVVICDVPKSRAGEGVLIRLYTHAPKDRISPTGRYQFSMKPEYFNNLQNYINSYLNPEVVKIVEIN